MRIDRVAPIFITKQFINEISRKVVGIPRDVSERRNFIILGVKMMAVFVMNQHRHMGRQKVGAGRLGGRRGVGEERR